jgi:crotonobetainyl-CoA:carnitine CoA-transferase CaiB-like acyl-CoA transferase
MGSSLPLAGLRVVALEQAVAAPLCSRHLADLGADVIKVERVDGGDFARGYDDFVHGMATHFVWLNRGKRSVALDLKSAPGRAALLALTDTADVLVSNLSSGALDRIVTDDELAARNPRLIRCAISGYGPAGPYRDRKAYDLLIQGEAGVTASTGEPGHPAKPGVSLADLGGGIYAVTAILAALHARERTGRGERVHVAMLDVLVEWMTPLLLAYREAGLDVPPAGTRHATITPYGPFPAADGATVNIAVQNDRQWQRLCAALGLRDLAADPRLAHNSGRLAHRDLVERSVAAATARHDRQALTAALDAADIPWGLLNGVPGVADHPQLAAGGRWIPARLPDGRTASVPAPPFRFGEPGERPAQNGRVPALGADTRAVLAAAGLAEDQIRGLLADGTAAGPGAEPPA